MRLPSHGHIPTPACFVQPLDAPFVKVFMGLLGALTAAAGASPGQLYNEIRKDLAVLLTLIETIQPEHCQRSWQKVWFIH